MRDRDNILLASPPTLGGLESDELDIGDSASKIPERSFANFFGDDEVPSVSSKTTVGVRDNVFFRGKGSFGICEPLATTFEGWSLVLDVKLDPFAGLGCSRSIVGRGDTEP